MDDIVIRRAGLSDASILSALASETFYDTFTGTCSPGDMDKFLLEYFNLPQVKKELSDPEDYFFIAFLKEDAMGYVRLKEDQSDVQMIDSRNGIELKRLYVKKEYHSEGVGAALTEYALDFALSNKYDTIFLSVWEHNERAKNFYKKFGFKNTGFSHPFPIGSTLQTDEWMIKDLLVTQI
jgi:ribosomal protein S18 acetylase RimI-like enzyme